MAFPSMHIFWSYSPPIILFLLSSLPLFLFTSLVVPLYFHDLCFVLLCFPLASTNERECDSCLCGTGLFNLTRWSSSIHFTADDNFILLNSQVKLHSGYIQHFLYSLIHWWAPMLIP
jgi:hypothetical protein